MTFLLLIFLGLLGAFAFSRWRRHRYRQDLLAAPIFDDERERLMDLVPILRKLPPELHASLEGKINLFLDQVEFHGCDGLDVTEDMELSIAAQACLLVVNTEAWYDHLTTILVYPGAFKSVQRRQDGYVVTEEETVRLGESWARGPIILSWRDSLRGGLNDQDGRNVVLHEFAHKLDEMSGDVNAVPVLEKGQSYATWGHVMTEAFQRHVRSVERARKTVLDHYGAESPEEFFAVLIEAFFEKPHQLQRDEPELYDEVSKLLRLDPATWTHGPRAD